MAGRNLGLSEEFSALANADTKGITASCIVLVQFTVRASRGARSNLEELFSLPAVRSSSLLECKEDRFRGATPGRSNSVFKSGNL